MPRSISLLDVDHVAASKWFAHFRMVAKRLLRHPRDDSKQVLEACSANWELEFLRAAFPTYQHR
jgi:hypothetical protein